MKRVPRLFRLLLLLSKEEKKLLLFDLIDDKESTVTSYLLPLMKTASIEDMYKREGEWLKKHGVSSNKLWHIRNKAYWLIISILDRYWGSGDYISKIMQLYRVEMFFRTRKNSQSAFPDTYKIIPPNREEIWFFYHSTWWYEYALRTYAYENHPFLKNTIVDDIASIFRYSYSAFKILSAFRSANAFTQQDTKEVQAIIKHINNIVREPTVLHHETTLFFLSILLYLSKIGFFDTYNNLIQIISEWDEVLHQLSILVMQHFHLPQTEQFTLAVPWQKVKEAIYAFPAMGIFSQNSVLVKKLNAESLSLGDMIRRAWWAVMNGRLDIGSVLFDKAQKELSPDKWHPIVKEIFLLSMAWIYFIRYKNKAKAMSHIYQLESRQKSTYNILHNLYTMFFAIEEENWEEVRRSAEALYRFAHRNKFIEATARVIRWLGRNLNETNKSTIWEKFKSKLKDAYKQQPWNIHLESMIPLRIYTEAKIRNTDLCFIDSDIPETKWFSQEELQESIEALYQVSPDTSLIVEKATQLSNEMRNWLDKLQIK